MKILLKKHVEKTCRLCAKNTFNTKNLLEIFQLCDDNGYDLSEYNLKIFKNDGLPQKICKTCSQTFKRVNDFIQKCKSSQKILEKRYSRITQQEFINENDIKKSPIQSSNDNLNDNFWNKIDNLYLNKDNRSVNQYDGNNKGSDDNEIFENNCEYCSIDFKSSFDLNIHLEKFHPKEKLYLCSICFENFPTKIQLSKHLKSLCKINREKFILNEKLKMNYVEETDTIDDNVEISYNEDTTENNYEEVDDDEDCENEEDDQDDDDDEDYDEKNDKIFEPTETTTKIKIIKTKRKKSVWGKDRIYECEKCDKMYDKFRDLLAHRKLNHSEEKEKYLCDFCGKEFKKRSAYSDHRNIHTQETPHKCAICDKAFLNRHALKKHIRDLHSNKERITFPCEICGKIFLSTSALQNHVKTHSEGYEESLFQCKYCSKKFKLLATLTIHCNSHNKPKNSKHQCPECLQFFKRSDHMKEHLLSVHLKKFPFPCELCDKKFVTGAKRSTHVKLAHSGIRYPCNVYGCEKEFCSLFSLNRHKRKHNGEKRYKCEVCHETFATTKQISKHIETHKLDENVKKQLIELTYANIQKEVETLDM